MLRSRDAKKAYDALLTIQYNRLSEFNVLFATVDWSNPGATKAVQTIVRGLVIKYGNYASKIAQEQYSAGQAVDAIFEPFTWKGMDAEKAAKLDSMVENACRKAIENGVWDSGKLKGSLMNERRARKALDAILDQHIREIMIESTLENGLAEQAIIQSYKKSERYDDVLHRNRIYQRQRRRFGSGFDGVYWGIIINSPIPCDWCIKQASRGRVFLSEQTALNVLKSAHKSCTCQVFAGTEPPQGYEKKLEQYKDWYSNGVPQGMDEKRKAQWEENRRKARAEESAEKKAAKEAAKQSD